MANTFGTLAVVASLACGTAHADRIATTNGPVLMPSRSASSPYRVELIDGYGRQLDTYRHRGRFYVLGGTGDRYSIRVHNPTGNRIEAVVSVDGLDVIDGKTANFDSKRGYVVPPYDSITIEGFRTSTANVATFRFSSVANSYAGRKGQARNVGVIGVAIFEEKAAPAIIQPDAPYYRRYNDYRDYLGDDERPLGGSRPPRSESGASKGSTAKRPSSVAPSRPAPSRKADGGGMSAEAAPSEDRCYDCGRQRPGLGTEFGESRYSAVSWTRFVRRSNRPDAIATLRYNDATGLAALGIIVPNRWDDEIATRETAEPFPGTFSEPPPGY